MIEVKSPSAGQHDWMADLTAFCAAHPVPAMDSRQARRLMELVRGPEAVLEVWNESARRAVLAVIDTCASVDDSADLALLGQVDEGLDAASVAFVLDCAESFARTGPCRVLDIALEPVRASWEPVLRARGYMPAYSLFSMERAVDAPCPPPRTPLPEGWTWQPLHLDWIADYHRVVSAAFALLPGAFVPSLPAMIEWLASSPSRPSVLVENEQVKAFCATQIHDTPRGRVGELRSLGRDPAHRASGLGEHIMCHGIAELRDQGADMFELSVAARNTTALALYERYGFHIVQEVPTLRRQLTPPG